MIKKNFKNALKILRGYKVLKDNKSLRKIIDVQNYLLSSDLKIPQKALPSVLVKNNYVLTQKIIKQFLFCEVGGVPLNIALLGSITSKEAGLGYPMPKVWREVLTKEGWKIQNFKSAFFWQLTLIRCFLKGLVVFLRTFSPSIKNFKMDQETKEKFVFFCNLNSDAYFTPDISPTSYNLISWYLNWPEHNKYAKLILHDVKNVLNQKYNFTKIQYSPLFSKPKRKIRFYLMSGLAIMQSLVDLCRGHWWTPLVLPEIIYDLLFQNQSHMAEEYWFHNGCAARPLWTYTASQKGSKIIYYFFATNIEIFHGDSNDSIIHPCYQNMTWDYYMVWDIQQSHFLQKCGTNKKCIQVVGPICAFDSAADLPEYSGISIAVFDVSPRRMSVYATLGLPFEYYTPKNCCQFLQDIVEVATEQHALIVWKGKRNLIKSSTIAKSYLGKIQSLKNKKNFIIADPKISPQKVIKKCSLTISMPFSSPSLIAKNLNKRTCFYDPTQTIKKDDPAARGLLVISGKNELRSVIADHILNFS